MKDHEFPKLPSPLDRDYELESVLLGSATRMIDVEADPTGGIFYQFGRKAPRCINLTEDYGLRQYILIDMATLAVILEPGTARLLAISAWMGIGDRVILFGANWGYYLDENAKLHYTDDMAGMLRYWRVPVSFNEHKDAVMIDFQINIHDRGNFHPDLLATFRPGTFRYNLSLIYDYPSGNYAGSRLQVSEMQSQRLRWVHNVPEFPIHLPKLKRLDYKQTPEPTVDTGHVRPQPQPQSQGEKPAQAEDSQPRTSAERFGRRKKAGAGKPDNGGNGAASGKINGTERGGEPSGGDFPDDSTTPPWMKKTAAQPAKPSPPRRPAPQTTHLSTHEMLSMLSTEDDEERQWEMVEANLMLGRPERTYPLILNYADLIAENTVEWSPARLRSAFHHQPGSILMGVMHRWTNDRVLMVADQNAEEEALLDWMREREVDRLLKLDIGKDPVSAADAREILRLSREASKNQVKKTWRVLLQAVHADRGRSTERAIHRRKDEIAKVLQHARDILMRQG